MIAGMPTTEVRDERLLQIAALRVVSAVVDPALERRPRHANRASDPDDWQLTGGQHGEDG
jgi:hypothetical protein